MTRIENSNLGRVDAICAYFKLMREDLHDSAERKKRLKSDIE